MASSVQAVPVRPEHMEAACGAVAAIVPATRGEEGCLTFEPRRAADGSPTILIYEEWADRLAFDHHHAQDYTKDVFAKYEAWLRDAPDLVVARPLES